MTNIFDQMADGVPQDPSASDLHKHRDEQITERQREQKQTSPEVKLLIQELLRHGYLEESNRQSLFRNVLVNSAVINTALEPLDLTLRVDSHRGVAFLVVAQNELESGSDDEGWNHPLVRKQRLTLEQSLLIAILRQSFAMHEQEYGVGQSAAKVSVDELLPNFLTYFGDSGSDAKNETRLLQLLDQLKAHGIVSEVDQKQEVVIRPLIAHLANPESLSTLLAVLKDKKQSTSDCDEGV